MSVFISTAYLQKYDHNSALKLKLQPSHIEPGFVRGINAFYPELELLKEYYGQGLPEHNRLTIQLEKTLTRALDINAIIAGYNLFKSGSTKEARFSAPIYRIRPMSLYHTNEQNSFALNKTPPAHLAKFFYTLSVYHPAGPLNHSPDYDGNYLASVVAFKGINLNPQNPNFHSIASNLFKLTYRYDSYLRHYQSSDVNAPLSFRYPSNNYDSFVEFNPEAKDIISNRLQLWEAKVLSLPENQAEYGSYGMPLLNVTLFIEIRWADKQRQGWDVEELVFRKIFEHNLQSYFADIVFTRNTTDRFAYNNKPLFKQKYLKDLDQLNLNVYGINSPVNYLKAIVPGEMYFIRIESEEDFGKFANLEENLLNKLRNASIGLLQFNVNGVTHIRGVQNLKTSSQMLEDFKEQHAIELLEQIKEGKEQIDTEFAPKYQQVEENAQQYIERLIEKNEQEIENLKVTHEAYRDSRFSNNQNLESEIRELRNQITDVQYELGTYENKVKSQATNWEPYEQKVSQIQDTLATLKDQAQAKLNLIKDWEQKYQQSVADFETNPETTEKYRLATLHAQTMLASNLYSSSHNFNLGEDASEETNSGTSVENTNSTNSTTDTHSDAYSSASYELNIEPESGTHQELNLELEPTLVTDDVLFEVGTTTTLEEGIEVSNQDNLTTANTEVVSVESVPNYPEAESSVNTGISDDLFLEPPTTEQASSISNSDLDSDLSSSGLSSSAMMDPFAENATASAVLETSEKSGSSASSPNMDSLFDFDVGEEDYFQGSGFSELESSPATSTASSAPASSNHSQPDSNSDDLFSDVEQASSTPTSAPSTPPAKSQKFNFDDFDEFDDF